MDFLLTLPPVRALQREPIYQVLTFTYCIVSLLARPNVLIMDFLLTLPPVRALQREPVYQVLTGTYCIVSLLARPT